MKRLPKHSTQLKRLTKNWWTPIREGLIRELWGKPRKELSSKGKKLMRKRCFKDRTLCLTILSIWKYKICVKYCFKRLNKRKKGLKGSIKLTRMLKRWKFNWNKQKIWFLRKMQWSGKKIERKGFKIGEILII